MAGTRGLAWLCLASWGLQVRLVVFWDCKGGGQWVRGALVLWVAMSDSVTCAICSCARRSVAWWLFGPCESCSFSGSWGSEQGPGSEKSHSPSCVYQSTYYVLCLCQSLAVSRRDERDPERACPLPALCPRMGEMHRVLVGV